MTGRDAEEYTALRATIRERGTTRIWVFLIGMIAWAALVIATAALAALPIGTLLPLLVLAGVFQAVYALHVGVERIGRYLQVYFEEASGWEHVAMAYGRAFGGGPDPLFTLLFAGATILNFIPVLLAEPTVVEVTEIGFLHVLFIARLGMARRAAGRQRAVDLERFERLKNETMARRSGEPGGSGGSGGSGGPGR
jgi:hypothetical protein